MDVLGFVFTTFLMVQVLSTDCTECNIGNEVKKSNPTFSVWSLQNDSPKTCSAGIQLGGVKVVSMPAESPKRQRLVVQLNKIHFSSENGYICQTLKKIRTGVVSTMSTSNFYQFISSTTKPSTSLEDSTTTLPPSSTTFTFSVVTGQFSPTVPSTETSVSTAATQSSSKQTVPSVTSSQYSRLTYPHTSLYLSESATSSFLKSSWDKDVTTEAILTSSNLDSSTMTALSTISHISTKDESNVNLSPNAVPCPLRYDVSRHSVSCYQFIYSQLMFSDASNYCKDIQSTAHLVSFESQAEEAWILQIIHNTTNASGQDYWIGLKNAVYAWEDGSYLSYANFGDKYTDNGGKCLFMDVSKDSIWKGGKCDDKKEFLCEYEATEYSSSSCAMQYGNSCYEVQKSKERAIASQICEGLGQYVTQIETAGEQVYLNTVLSNDVWIGLLKNESAKYVWEGKNNTAAEYFNFGDANSVVPLPHGGICHRMKQDDSYSWNEDRCDTEHSFICEWSLDLGDAI